MLDKTHFKDLITYILIIGLFVLAAMIIKPVVYSMIYGILLAYILYPVYKWTLSKLKNETLSAFLVCICLLVILLVITTLIFTTLVKQIVNVYLYLQKIDIVNVIRNTFSPLFSSEFSTNMLESLNALVSNLLANSLTEFGNLVLNLPTILLQLLIVVFVFFFSLRDGEKAIEYIKSLSPLKTETNEKFSKQFKDVTNSVLIGYVVVGLIQGLVAGIGYLIFGVPNALLLTLLTMFASIIPMIGPWLVWVPIDIYLFTIERTAAGFGLLIYGLILVSSIDNLIRPFIVSRKTQINMVIIIIGMIGGLFALGILGVIIGPLILAYVLLVIEIYRKKNFSENIPPFITEKKEEKDNNL